MLLFITVTNPWCFFKYLQFQLILIQLDIFFKSLEIIYLKVCDFMFYSASEEVLFWKILNPMNYSYSAL